MVEKIGDWVLENLHLYAVVVMAYISVGWFHMDALGEKAVMLGWLLAIAGYAFAKGAKMVRDGRFLSETEVDTA